MITYIATNTLNGKFYVGSTVDFESRKKSHLRSDSDYPFHRSLRNNPEAFEWETVVDDSEEPILEQALLDVWFGKEQCYNLSPSAYRPPGMAGKTHTEETKLQMSVVKQGHLNGMYGRTHSEESRQKMKQEGESNAMFGKKGEDHPRFGKKHSDETKQKIREKRVGSTGLVGEDNPMYGRFGDKHPMFGKTGENNPNYGKKWWVNASGQTHFEHNPPGPDWQPGRKWRPQ